MKTKRLLAVLRLGLWECPAVYLKINYAKRKLLWKCQVRKSKSTVQRFDQSWSTYSSAQQPILHACNEKILNRKILREVKKFFFSHYLSLGELPPSADHAAAREHSCCNLLGCEKTEDILLRFLPTLDSGRFLLSPQVFIKWYFRSKQTLKKDWVFWGRNHVCDSMTKIPGWHMFFMMVALTENPRVLLEYCGLWFVFFFLSHANLI